MSFTTDNRLTVGQGRKVRIVNHHNSWLNGKCGFLIAKEGFYGRRVCLEKEGFDVIVPQIKLIPATTQVIAWQEVFAIHWYIFWHNMAVKIRGWLTK